MFQKFLFSALAVCLLGSVGTADSISQVREVWRPLGGHIGKASLDRYGNPYVTMNPRRCRQLGPALCEFFRAHEHAHVRLNHLKSGISVPNAEAQADCWAAKNVSPQAARAAARYFGRGNGGGGLHGSPNQRARRVAGCSRNKRSLAAMPTSSRRFYRR